MNIRRIVILILFGMWALHAKSQDSIKCYEDFNMFSNEGIKLINDCSGKNYVQCFYRSGKIYKFIVVYDLFGTQEKEKIIVKEYRKDIYYCFDKFIEPREGQLRIIRDKKSKRYDTLLVRNDTIYHKSLLYQYVELSKCCHINQDTFKIVLYGFEMGSPRNARRKSLQNYADYNNILDSINSTEIGFTINNKGVHFFKYQTTKKYSYDKELKESNNINGRIKFSQTLFWVYIIYRFQN